MPKIFDLKLMKKVKRHTKARKI